MKILWVLILYLISSIPCLGQTGAITGKVLQLDSSEPLSANVFLSNTSFSTICAADGSFNLSGLKDGQYTLVVSLLGYETFKKPILINNSPVSLIIKLDQKKIQLQQVSVSAPSKSEWKLYYDQFKDKFIGIDKNARNCKILNPDAIYFRYDKKAQQLSASTLDFIVIENESLGYRIKFLLEDFNSDGLNNTISYTGQSIFEELKGTDAQKKKWSTKRKETYLGSAKHFYQSLSRDSLLANGFEMYRLHRQLTQKSSNVLTQKANVREIQIGSGYSNERLDKVQWKISDIVKPTKQTGVFSITFPDYLYVVYKNKHNDDFYNIYRPENMPNYQITIVSLLNDSPYVLFDTNGSILSDVAPFYEGDWSKARLSELLPIDYNP